MKFLIILTFILCILIIDVAVFYLFIKYVHNKLFNYHQNTNTSMDTYTPEEFNLSLIRYEVTNNNQTIRGYFYQNENYNPNKLVIFCHGMWSTKETYLQDIGYLANNGFQVLAFDYLGVGESDGKILGIGSSLKSLDIVLSDLKEKNYFKDKEIYCIGHSWGGYAALNIVKYHPDVKGVIGMAPLTCVKESLRTAKVGSFIGTLFTYFDEKYYHKYSLQDAVKSLDLYQGKVLILQSRDDKMVPFEYSLKRIKDNTVNKNIKYLEVDNRSHNPEYTIRAVEKLNDFLAKDRVTKKNKKQELYNQTDFRACGEIDQDIFANIINFINE